MLKTVAKYLSKKFVRQKCTLAFTRLDLHALKIRYVGVKSVDEIFPKSGNTKSFKHLLLQRMSTTEIRAMNLTKDRRFSDEQKGLIQRLQRIIINESVTLGTEESKTSDMVEDLLVALGLNRFPLSVSRQALFKFDPGLDEDVTSQPGFTAEIQEQVLFVDEDRRIKDTNRIKQWGEFQLAGEMLVCGLARSKLEGNISVHGMRVTGT